MMTVLLLLYYLMPGSVLKVLQASSHVVLHTECSLLTKRRSSVLTTHPHVLSQGTLLLRDEYAIILVLQMRQAQRG